MESPLQLPFLPSWDITAAPDDTGFNLQHLGFLGCVFLTVTDADITQSIAFVQENARLDSYVDARGVSALDDVVAILEAGARRVWVHGHHAEELSDHRDRVLRASCTDIEKMRGGLLINLGHEAAAFRPALQRLKDGNVKSVFLRSSDSNVRAFVDLAAEFDCIPIIPASKLTIASAEDGQLAVADLIADAWSTDREDKLMPTIVTDERGTALGLVYSSRESLAESMRTGKGVYMSRRRGLWYKGATSGDTQELIRIRLDCDQDCLMFTVRQLGRGFCHLPQPTCFGPMSGIGKLEKTLLSRKASAPSGSYTARLFSDAQLLRAKIMEEAEELCDAKSKSEIAFEAADLIYFALAKAVSAGVTLSDIEHNLDAKSHKIKRRQGNAKGRWAAKEGITNGVTEDTKTQEPVKEAASVPKSASDPAGTSDGKIRMRRFEVAKTDAKDIKAALQRPSQKSTQAIMGIVEPIIEAIKTKGDQALLSYTHKFEKATALTTPILKAPFAASLMQLSEETISAIDISFANIHTFHSAQKESKPLRVETMPGVVCSRFSRPISRVGLYVPGGTAVLPSTALMLGVPAMVAGCKRIIMASPPRPDGTITPEIVYIAHKIGAEAIVLAGGAQAIAALAYGTESVSKVDKILGPGNQFVTAAKMHVSNDTNAGVSIDMPAGPSEILVIADATANPVFVAADLLSQAEHGVDSQVILIAVGLDEQQLTDIEDELHKQALQLPRLDIVRGSIAKSSTFVVTTIEEAMRLSNEYAPEHLSLQVENAAEVVKLVHNAGSVFIGHWTPESASDYSTGVNHSLPTYGYARQYSGVNLASYVKHITSSELTPTGLRNVGTAVMRMAAVEELDAHRRAVEKRLAVADGTPT